MRHLGLIALAVFIHPLHAQGARRIEGVVVERAGSPVTSANVFIAGTLDGAITDSLGRFSISTPRQPAYEIAVRRVGFRPSQVAISDSVRASLTIVLQPDAGRVPPIVIQAGRYTAGDEPGATLTPLEIVTTPGTAADVNRAIQTLPGVQQVDEGTGLFVRGGDYTETRVFLNDGLLLNPARLENAAGTFVGTLDPFLLEGVSFTAGGFGARYGDALSAIAELHTQRRPATSVATVSAGLAAVGVNLALAGPGHTGFRLVGDHNDLSPVVRLNGSPRQFTTPPRGDDAAASAEWSYRPESRVSLFATRQTALTGALNVSPSVVDTFTTSTRESAIVARWSDVFGSVSPSVVVSSSRIVHFDDYGSFRLDSPSELTRVSASVEAALTNFITTRSGMELGRETSGANGSVPARGSDQSRGARTKLYDERRGGRRFGEFEEVEWRPAPSARLTAGLRQDITSFTSAPTYDPRLNGALRVSPWLAFTGAWGYYHQAVDPLLQAMRSDTTGSLPSMRARQTIFGIDAGEEGFVARIELYEKSYDGLAGQTRDFVTVAGGVGRSRGMDLLLHAVALAGFDTRIVWSYADSRRTDPSTGQIAPAPADITHCVTAIATRPFRGGIIMGSTFRYASGRPFTPVVSARRLGADTVFTPAYGAPNSERLPAYARLDLSASWYRVVRANMQAVAYVAVSNVLNRPNVYTRQYTPDYSSFSDVRSIFNRSFYLGTVLTFGRSQ